MFHNKRETRQHSPSKPINLDRGLLYKTMFVLLAMSMSCLDDGGIYKSRANHLERPAEIHENEHTKVDLPIGYRSINTVDEENLHNNSEVSLSSIVGSIHIRKGHEPV
jgi:hypothetical protein